MPRPITYLLKWVWQTRGLARDILGLVETIEERTRDMVKQADLDALASRLDTATTELGSGIAGVRSDLDALKAQNPDLDTTAIEASVSRVEDSARVLTELDAQNPAASNPDGGAPTT